MLNAKNVAIGVSFLAAIIFLYDWLTQFIPPPVLAIAILCVIGMWWAHKLELKELRQKKREAEHRKRLDAALLRVLTISEAILATKVRHLPQDDPLREELEKLLVANNAVQPPSDGSEGNNS
ncbi:MAG: hypothetical protein F4137_15550 [Acidobacteria bacterium]|nr:hypothetical protein [Acidobacteriota bacterium]